jgi:hypothetical protein
MQLPEEIRKCVVFVGQATNSGAIRMLGTAFFLARTYEGTDQGFTYCITAKHIVEGIRRSGGYQVFLRVNLRGDKFQWISTDLGKWLFHPTDDTVDVAVLRIAMPDEFDQLSYPLRSLVTADLIGAEGIGIGDEVFLVGLFAQHCGSEKNIPIVRVGNIAAMPEEPVATKMGMIEAYLMEARSIGGISGSPVFVHLGTAPRIIDGRTTPAMGRGLHYLLGLMHGHWDLPASSLDMTVEDKANEGRVNMGIAIVVPTEKILEVINQPAIRGPELVAEAKMREKNLPVMDSPGESPED